MAPSWRAFLQQYRKPHNRLSLLSYLFPNVAQRTQQRLQYFRYGYLPALRHRAESRIYRHLVASQARRQQRNERGVFASLRRRSLYHLRRRTTEDGARGLQRSKMAYTGSGNALAYGDSLGLRPESREPGARRQKLAGLFRAGKEVASNYFSGDGARDGSDEHGAFPDAAVVRSGNEEMILFPSYARKHVKSTFDNIPGNDSEQEYWRKAWDKNMDDKALVDVDVRGWIYTPQRGQNTRKQRLLIGLCRQMCGIPAPPATSASETLQSSQASSRAPSPTRKQEEELIQLQAENLVRLGQKEERKAQRGAYSESPGKGADSDSLYDSRSRDTSPVRPIARTHRLSTVSTTSSLDDDSASIKPMQKQSSWSQSSRMSAAELTAANAHLLNRLRPFMANPLANTPISAFFYNEHTSRQHTVYTNASGHFTCRAALEFTPTHVRILAGEKLSATEEVIVTSPKGVSLISDIDDTIKHSAIGSGPREIFRNAFVRDFSDLTIEGVKEWYNTLHDMGVKLHYVSNSPWQMYPALTTFFKLAHLPKGSFHLKQYSGMLQGIFEPVAERKKASLDKLLRDFPDRKFILVGDSGEADLEVYTDTALENPDRILGIFIRDVTTTPARTGYFDPSGFPAAGGRHSRNHSRHRSGDSLAVSKRLSRPDDIRNDDVDLKAAIANSLADMEEEARQARRSINPDAPNIARFEASDGRMERPRLPARPQTEQWATEGRVVASPDEDLIDFGEDAPPSKPWLEPPPPRRRSTPKAGSTNDIHEGERSSPAPPPKPHSLRSPSPSRPNAQSSDSTNRLPPPRPRKPSSTVKPPSPQPPQTEIPKPPSPNLPLPQLQTHQPSPLSQVQRQESSPVMTKQRPPLPARPTTVRGLAKEKLASAYNALPSSGGHRNPEAAVNQVRPLTASSRNAADTPRALSTVSTKSMDDLRSGAPTPKAAPPVPPPRRNLSSYPFPATRKTTNRLSSGFESSDGGSLPGSPGEAGMSKKEYLWKQRWVRAQSLLETRGVTLRSWRTGSDVADVCVRLAEMELRKIERENRALQNGP